MNHLLESVYYKFKVNLQLYSVNFCFLIYWWQRWDLKGISDDIWRQGGTTVVPTHPLSLLSAGDQPRLIQGIRRRDGVGEDQETIA